MGGINNDKAMKSILEGVDYMIKKAIKDAPSDKIYVATVLEAKNNNLYKIQLKDKVYDNIPSLFQDIIQNEPVRVVVPQNNYNQMFILGKHNMDMLGDYNKLKNKPQINGIELKGNKTAKDLGLVAEAMIAELYTDKEFKTGEYTIYQGEIYKAKKDTKVTIDEETKYVPPYDTDYWEKIPNVMSQIVALAKMYNDFDNYTKGDYAMYDGDVYKLIEDTNDSTGIFYPYRVSIDEGIVQVTKTDGRGMGFDFTTYKGTGALVWYTVDNLPYSDNSNQWVMVSQDPTFTILNIPLIDYDTEWFQDILNDPTHPQYDRYVKRVYIGYDDINHYKFTLDNGEVWYVCFAYRRSGWDNEPDYSKGSREYGIHIPVDRDVWYYRWPDGGTVSTRDFLEYILSIIITKGAKQPPTNSNYWRKVGYLMDEVTDYDNLKNKPKINGHELIGDKSTADLEILPPIASKTQFGGVIIGDGIDIDETGKISINGDFLPAPTLDGNIMVVENEEWIQKPLEDAETDPTVPQYVKDITEEDIERWNQGGGGGSGLPTPTANDNILVSNGADWEQKNISTSTIPSFTKAEYALLKDTIPTGTRFIITDDNEVQTAIRSDGLEIYSADWIATSSNALGYELTNAITLSEGKYLVICQHPMTTNDAVFWSQVYVNDIIPTNPFMLCGGSCYNAIFMIDATEDNTVIQLKSAQSDSISFSYLERGFMKAIKLDTLFDASAPSDIYSINEKVIGKWINNKPLYQKTYVLNNISSSTSDWTRLLEVEDADNIISIDGFAVGTSNQQKLQINSAYISTRTLNNVINYYADGISSWRFLDFTITIQYTKGSD